MGAVYEAEHVATEQRVALKVLLPQMLQLAAARRRFELEAKVSARVNCEHIVRVLDAGVDGETPYLAMELLSGETLAARVRHDGPLAAPSALELLRQVGRGLDAAHGYRTADGTSQPIVHRDLKPENLFLVRRTDGSSLVKIVDFGIAKVLSEATGVSREVRGTPLYMAFEQVAGEAVSPQTDVWALGLVAYFMLTGQSYWSAPSKAVPSTEALFAQILTLPLPRPSDRLRDHGIVWRVPAAFDAWLLTCLERKPLQRYASAGAAVAALERALEGPLRGESADPVRRLLGGRYGSRVTARYELPVVSSGGSVTSVPPVASDDGRAREAPRTRRAAGLRLSGALLLTASVAAGVTWGVTRIAGREPEREAPVSPGGSAAGEAPVAPRVAIEALEPAPRHDVKPDPAVVAPPVAPRPARQVAPPATASEPPPSHAQPALPAPPAATSPAPVTARPIATPPIATPPAATPPAAKPPVTAPLPAAPAPHAAAVNPAAPASHRAPPPSNASAAPLEKQSSAAEGPCPSFDPYTGRCTVATRAPK